MSTLTSFRKFLNTNSTIALVAAVFMIVSAAVTIERSGMLPFEGQASATYGALPVPTSKKTVKKVTVKKSSSSARVMRTAAPDAKPASAPSKTWTERECSDTSSEECKQKMRAMLTDDYSCLFDDQCKLSVVYCSIGNDCKDIQLRKWFFDTFFTDCLEKGDKDCIAGTAFMAGASAPDPVKACVNSGICREFLADFRRGKFTCRRYQPCLDALDALVKSPSCDTWGWCKNVRKIDSIYTNDWQKCPTIETGDCIAKLGLTPYITAVPRPECRKNSYCYDSAREVAESLRRFDYLKKPVPACFLWKECKDYFLSAREWSCNLPDRVDLCTKANAVYDLLTKTNPACVTSGESKVCQDTLKSLLQ